MAETNISIKEDEFCCSVCLDLLTDPVSLACGHSFCLSCINCSWDQSPGIYSCPQCREIFKTRPVLRRNNILAGVLDKLKHSGLQVSDQCYAESGDVECDLCTGFKCKAVKSCLVCLASFCDDHFRPHKESSALMTHTVIEASEKLLDKICRQHKRPLDVFCRTDQKCICYLCTLDEHTGHNVVSGVAEKAEKEKQVIETQNKFTQRILEREEDHGQLMENLDTIKHSAQVAVDDVEKMFKELIQSIEKKCSEMTNQIRAEENEEENHIKKHLKQVEQEIDELKSKNKKLMQLSQTKDIVLFFQTFQSFGDLSLPETSPRVNINLPNPHEDLKIFVHRLKKNIESAKFYPDSAYKLKTNVMTPQSSQTASHPKPSLSAFASFLAEPLTTLTPATQSKPVPAPTTTPATQFEPASAPTTTPATQSEPVPAFTFTPATQSKPVTAFTFTPATQSKPVPAFTFTPATQSKPVFAFTFTPATQSKPVPAFTTIPATQSKPVPTFTTIPATQSKPVPAFTTIPATQSKPVPAFTTIPATQSEPVSLFTAIPPTQSEPVPAFTTIPATQSEPVSLFTTILATQSKPVSASTTTSATQSEPVSLFTKILATQPKPVSASTTTPATQPKHVSPILHFFK